MMFSGPKTIFRGVLCFAIVAMCSSAAFCEENELVDTIASKVEFYKDGEVKFIDYKWNDEAGRFERIRPTGDDLRTFSQMILERTTRWEQQRYKINFNFTPDAIGNRKPINTIYRKYVKKRKGTSSIPIVKATKSTTQVKDLMEFPSIFEYKRQFQRDDDNTFVMTADDNFFRGFDLQLQDPDLVAYSWIFISGSELVESKTPSGPKYRTTFYIEEGDIYLRSDFFSLPNYLQRAILSSMIRFVFGYGKTCWAWGLSSDNRAYTEDMFEDAKHELWTDLAQEWDRMFYESPVSGPGYLDSVRVLPVDDSVIDMKGYQVPDTDPNNPDPTSRADTLFVTNLKGFEGKKRLIAKFTMIISDQNSKKKMTKKLFNLKSNAYDYPGQLGDITYYPTIWLNTIKLGRQAELDKLNNAIETYGTPLDIEGASYDKALYVEVKLTGYLEEDSKKKNQKVYVYFVNSDDDE